MPDGRRRPGQAAGNVGPFLAERPFHDQIDLALKLLENWRGGDALGGNWWPQGAEIGRLKEILVAALLVVIIEALHQDLCLVYEANKRRPATKPRLPLIEVVLPAWNRQDWPPPDKVRHASGGSGEPPGSCCH